MSAMATARPSPRSSWDSSSYFASTTPLGWPVRTPPSAGQSSTPRLGCPAPSPRLSCGSRSPSYFNIVPATTTSTATLNTQSSSIKPASPASGWPDLRLGPQTPLPPTPSPWTGDEAPRNGSRRQDEQLVALSAPVPYTAPIPEPLDTHGRPSRVFTQPTVFRGPAVSKGRTLQRADTTPALVDQGGVRMVSTEDCVRMLAAPSGETLLLDVRPAAQYSEARIKDSLNLCIPTTLLKRPSFNLQKVEGTLGSEQQKRKLRQWRTSPRILAYDSTTSHIRDALALISVLQKFTNEGWKGDAIILRGGFAQFASEFPDWVETDQNSAPASRPDEKSSLSINLTLPLPPRNPTGDQASATESTNPLHRNIRQNIELIDGVGQLPIKLPHMMTESNRRSSLPQWLQHASDPRNNGRSVSEYFLTIERAEQSRMQQALGDGNSYSASPGSKRSPNKKVWRIAGIEQGLKNRYSNIYPYDHSRVKLQGVASGSCDYVNANHVQASRSNKQYIVTQAPLPATFNDFWRVVWEQDVRVIVMLTAEAEGIHLKSHPYWNTTDYGPLQVRLVGEHNVPLGKVKNPDGEAPFMTVRHLTLAHSSLPFQPVREISQIQYTQWPDFGIPTEPSLLLGLVAECNRLSTMSASPTYPTDPAAPEPEGQRKVLVHCSAGCGRTGTFCTVDSVIDILKRQKWERTHSRRQPVGDADWVYRDDVDLLASTVEDFRRQRASMVQSLRQFVLCYESVLQWVAEEWSP